MKRSASEEEQRAYKREWYRKKHKVINVRSLLKDPSARFDFHTVYTGDCIMWAASVNSVTGYGQFNNGKTMVIAHRFAYERVYGAIPKEKQIDHLCKNRRCVNIAHLEAVMPVENIRRSGAYETLASQVRQRTHCKYGHPYTEDNLYRTKEGKRHCKTCRANAKSRYRQTIVNEESIAVRG